MKIIRKKNNQKSFKVYRELILKYRHSKPKQEKNISKLIENPILIIITMIVANGI